ncbi:hypothetical protein J6590_011254 [Homalodisca vitripennis]|nr:hypothetical protein J6590_011254 [Homalodisca vitripennis]
MRRTRGCLSLSRRCGLERPPRTPAKLGHHMYYGVDLCGHALQLVGFPSRRVVRVEDSLGENSAFGNDQLIPQWEVKPWLFGCGARRNTFTTPANLHGRPESRLNEGARPPRSKTNKHVGYCVLHPLCYVQLHFNLEAEKI